MNEQAAGTAGRDLLDATQQAVVGAAGNVESILKDTAEELHGGEEVFYLSAEFWVAMAFLLVVIGLFRPLKKTFLAYLDKHIESEQNRLDEAEKLKDDACALVAVYEEKLDRLAAETAAVVDKAKKAAGYRKKKAMDALEQKISLQEKNVAQRMQSDVLHAENELTTEVARQTISLLEQTLKRKLDDNLRAALIDESINKLAVK